MRQDLEFSSHVLRLATLLYICRLVVADCTFHCEAYDCPCECIRKEIRCGNRNVSNVYDFPTHRRYEMLDLGNNRISNLAKRHFSQKSMEHLSILQLSANEISYIEDCSFAGLKHLHSLFLNTNNIKSISKHTFAGLNKLKRLYLDKNKIEELHNNVFDHFKNSLKLLYLQNNRISFIEENTFKNFLLLRTLDLSGNRLLTLDGRFLRSTPAISHLFMGNNPWECMEKTVCLVMKMIDEKQREDDQLFLRDDMICQAPEMYQLKKMEIVHQLFDCDVINVTEPTVTDKNRNDGQYINPDAVVIAGCLIAWLLISLSLKSAC